MFFHPKVKVKETRCLIFFGILGVGWSEGVNKCIQADFKTDPGLENCPKFVGVVEQNKIQRTYFHYFLHFLTQHDAMLLLNVVLNTDE